MPVLVELHNEATLKWYSLQAAKLESVCVAVKVGNVIQVESATAFHCKIYPVEPVIGAHARVALVFCVVAANSVGLGHADGQVVEKAFTAEYGLVNGEVALSPAQSVATLNW